MSSSNTESPRSPPIIGIMLGDPGGIAPEVILKSLATGEPQKLCVPLLIGKRHVVERHARACGIPLEIATVVAPADARRVAGLSLLESGELRPEDYRFGQSSVASGHASWNWFEKAQELCRTGELDGWVMGPINSESIISAGHLTDINDLQPKGTYMLRVNGPLRIVPLSEHILLRDVADVVTPAHVMKVIRLLAGNLKKWGIPGPRIAVAGINPHASFAEDIDKIAPAVAQARAEGWNVWGPIAPDSVFRQTLEGRYDAIVTMYHDQGQIALKTTAFEGACTIFMGLPYVMLGIPHGSAYDIAGKGVAQHQSMLSGILTAARLASGRGFPANVML